MTEHYKLKFGKKILKIPKSFVKQSGFLSNLFDGNEETIIKVPKQISYSALIKLIYFYENMYDHGTMNIYTIEMIKCANYIDLTMEKHGIFDTLINELCEYLHKDNVLIQLLNKYPNESWNWNKLSNNPNITIDYIKYHMDKTWNLEDLSCNPNITMKDMLLNCNTDLLRFSELMCNPNMNMHTVDWNKDQYQNYIAILSSSASITMKDIINNPINWDYREISFNPNLTQEYIEKNINKSWNWAGMSKNPCINMKFVKKHDDKSWNWDALAYNSSITMDDIINNINEPWIYWKIACNPNITIEFVEKYIIDDSTILLYTEGDDPSILAYIENVYTNLSSNPGIDINTIKNNSNIMWNSRCITRNSNISMNDIKNNPEIQWDEESILHNPNITMEYIEKYIENYIFDTFGILSSNILIYANNQYFTKYLTEQGLSYDLIKYIIEKYVSKYHIKHEDILDDIS
jgi:hypothetical protein